jgi:hypothetical protein
MRTKEKAVFPMSKKSGLQGAIQTCVFPYFSGLLPLWPTGILSSGRGNEKNTELNNAAIPILWMANEALFAGIKLEDPKVLKDYKVVWDWGKLAETHPKESLTNVWHFFKLLPFKQLSYDNRAIPGNDLLSMFVSF